MAKEYIERDALIRAMRTMPIPGQAVNNGWFEAMTIGVNAEIKVVADFPASDVVEVVRCKDCKHFKACEEVEGATWTGFCNYGEIHTDEEDFCSRGERRKNNAAD